MQKQADGRRRGGEEGARLDPPARTDPSSALPRSRVDIVSPRFGPRTDPADRSRPPSVPSPRRLGLSQFKESDDDAVVRKTTLREVKVLRSLKHENIVSLKVRARASTSLPGGPARDPDPRRARESDRVRC